MEQQTPKIKFYEQRTFGEKFNAAFEFLKINWKPLLKWTTYFILPVCLIQMVFTLRYMDFSQSLMVMFSDLAGGGSVADYSDLIDWPAYSMLLLCQIIGMMFVTSVVYTLVIKYNESEDGKIDNITFNDMKPTLMRLMGRYLIAFLVVFVLLIALVLILGIAGAIMRLTLIFTLPIFVMLLVAICLLMPIYMFEKTDILAATSKSLRLGFATWGGTFLMVLVMSILAGIFSGIISMPFSVLTGINSILMASDAATISTSGFNMIAYLLGVISLYGGYIANILIVLGIVYQYAHANEKVNNVSVVDNIDKFENF